MGILISWAYLLVESRVRVSHVLRLYVCIYVCVCVCVCVYIYIYITKTSTHTTNTHHKHTLKHNIYEYMYMYVHIYIYTYTYIICIYTPAHLRSNSCSSLLPKLWVTRTNISCTKILKNQCPWHLESKGTMKECPLHAKHGTCMSPRRPLIKTCCIIPDLLWCRCQYNNNIIVY